MIQKQKRWLLPLAVVGALSVSLAGCSSGTTAAGGPSASASPSGTYPLTAGVLHAFTGQNAFFGLNAQAACKAAAIQINAGGGIMGHPLNCEVYDTKGDPADAVPVTNRMLVSASHLQMVVGPDGSDIPSVIPLTEAAKVAEMNTVGDPRYDTQTSQFFWRLTPSDSKMAPALSAYTISKGYTKIVDVFTSDLSASTTVTPFHSAYTAAGGTLLKSILISADQASYQTEVAQVLAMHPQAIVGEMDARTAATFLSEEQQQNNGNLIPFISTQRATQADWAQAVGPAIGAGMRSVTAVAPVLTASGTAFTDFETAMDTIGANPFQKKNSFVAATYDGVIAFALAMDMAKSIDSSVWVKDIAAVTAGGNGAVVVNTYADAVAALQAGKTIQYVGASGPMVFDQYNTANRPYGAYHHDKVKQAWVLDGVIPQN